MHVSSILHRSPEADAVDHRVFLHGVTWDQLETFLAIRGDAAGVRIAYLEGELELMSPSVHHERIKKTIARLLEAYAEERNIELNGFGSWTLRSAPRERAVEPDECYVLGTEPGDAPDLAIEVNWTHGGLSKLSIYAGLGVKELWLWRDGALTPHVLRGDTYVAVDRSEFLPDLDLQLLASFVSEPSQMQAVRAFRAALRS